MTLHLRKYAWIVVLSLALSACADQLNLGVEAYNRGDYDAAAAYWNPLAKTGDPYAQYNLGLLWENGLGKTPRRPEEAARWYLQSANQGYTPAMVALAKLQWRSGHQEAALSWLTLAARWNDQSARSLLASMGKPVPAADLHSEREIQRLRAQQAADEAWGKAGYALGCAIAGGSCSTSSGQSPLGVAPYLEPGRSSLVPKGFKCDPDALSLTLSGASNYRCRPE